MLIDNKRNNKLGDVLKSHIKTNAHVSIVTNHFTIHAYEELKKELKKIKNIRVICSASNFKNDINLLSSEQEEIKLKNNLNQTKIAKEFAQFLEHHAQIKETSSLLTFITLKTKMEAT